MMSNKLWTVGLHAMFGFLLVFGVLRAWADDRLDARALGLSIALAVVYTGFAIFGSRTITRPVPTTLWLAALCLLWIGLMVHAQDFMWLEFPLVFVFIHALPFWPGIVASVVLWAVAAFVPAWIHPQFWTAAAAIGPFIGTCFAVGVYHAARRVQAEAAHHAAVAKQLRETQEELAASEHQAGRLEERERLSREIHDTVAQGLSSIVLLSRAAKNTSAQQDVTEQLALIEKVAQDNLAEARRFVKELAAPASSIDAELRTLVDELQAQAKGLGLRTRFGLKLTGSADVPTEFSHVILRAAREGLTNVMKHADADRAVVTLGSFEDGIILDIVDDGRGIEGPRGFGLTGLEQRVRSVGGSVQVESSPAGTALAVRIPTGSSSNGQRDAHRRSPRSPRRAARDS